MQIESIRQPHLSGTEFRVFVPDLDIFRVKLDKLDRSVVFDPSNTVADTLLSLQILAFRLSQQDD